jgi:formylglycine-generating enzyme
MRGRARVILAVAVALGAAACAQLIGVQSADPGAFDAGAGKDAGPKDEGGKSRDATQDGQHDVKGHGGHDSGQDVAQPACDDATPPQCWSNGLGMLQCGAKGEWVDAGACPGDMPICLAGSCTCAPGATQCGGADYQDFQTCVTDGGSPTWVGNAACPGTCTLAGCGAMPPSCDVGDGGSVEGVEGIGNCYSRDGDQTSICCMSNEVPGGTFSLSYDMLPPWDDPTDVATVQGFRLDRYEVTVARFHPFVDDVRRGWTPPAGSGKHSYLNSGQGLATSPSTYETGWESGWDAQLGALAADGGMTGVFSTCGGILASWPNHSSYAMNCVTWFEAYAFCIWDGGFLPTEAEWNYAAAGGDEQRYYPWSVAPDNAGCANANFVPNKPCESSAYIVGFTSPVKDGGSGDSKWLQSDMAGNVVEWTLDAYTGATSLPPLSAVVQTVVPPADASIDTVQRALRGGSFASDSDEIRVSARGGVTETTRAYVAGLRCARAP